MDSTALEYEQAVRNGTMPSARVELTPAQRDAWDGMLAAWRRYCAHPTRENTRAYYGAAVSRWEAVR